MRRGPSSCASSTRVACALTSPRCVCNWGFCFGHFEGLREEEARSRQFGLRCAPIVLHLHSGTAACTACALLHVLNLCGCLKGCLYCHMYCLASLLYCHIMYCHVYCLQGPITIGSAFAVQPFGNLLAVKQINGYTLFQVMRPRLACHVVGEVTASTTAACLNTQTHTSTPVSLALPPCFTTTAAEALLMNHCSQTIVSVPIALTLD